MSNRKKKRKQARKLARRAAARTTTVSSRARRAERRRQGDAITASALRKLQSTQPRISEHGLPEALEHAVRRHAPALAEPYYADTLSTLAKYPWVRGLDDWQPRGKSPRTKLKSLVRHLLVRYPMPAFMFEVFTIPDDDLRRAGIELFVHLGRGGSLFRYVRDGHFPVPLTRRMCHRFMQSPARLGFLEAIRRAQVSELCGDHQRVTAIVNTRQLGRRFTDDEVFWAEVILWTCNQTDISPSEIGPIYEFIVRRRRADPKFSMKGRTGRSVQQAMAQWHGLLTFEDGDVGVLLPCSGYEDWHHVQAVRPRSGHPRIVRHAITEIRNTRELAEEGFALRHCVRLYARLVRRGTTSIWSYKIDGRRTLTLELDHRTGQVVQCRGKANRMPSRAELTQVERFAASNGVTVRRRR